MHFVKALAAAILASCAVAVPDVEVEARSLAKRAMPAGTLYTWWVGGSKNCDTEPKAYAGFIPVGDCIYNFPGLTRKIQSSNYCVDFYTNKDCAGAFPQAGRVARNVDKCVNDPDNKILSFKITDDC